MNLLGTHAKNGPRPDYREALLDSLVKLNPLYLWKDSPVMLVVEAGFALVLAMGFAPGAFAGLVNQSRWFYFVIAGILLLTVWFSTFSEAVSEAQGRARVDALRTLEKDVPARKIVGDSEVIVPSRFLDPGDVVRASAGEFIPRDGGANVVAKSGKAVEAAGDVDILILDKTGTITEGQRTVKEFVPLKGYTKEEVGQAAYLASVYDHTPEGRSIIEVAKKNGWVL